MRSALAPFFTTFLLFSSLADAKVADPTPVVPDPITQITHNGHNRQPIFINNEAIVYVSRNRKEHKDTQIYQRDLITGIEKRITYQRGHIVNGVWLQDNSKLLYASSTDEEKETPVLLKEYLKRFPASVDTEFFFHLDIRPTEIYSSDLKGEEITRLSYHPGFDSFPAYHKKNRTLYFSRLDEGRINIFKQAYGSRNKAKRVINTLGHDLGLKLSPKKDQFVWYRFSPDFNSSQLMISEYDLKEPKFLTIDDGIQWSPVWHPNQETVIFSAKKGSDKSYEIYEVSLKDKCQRKLTSLEGDEFYPAVSEDGKRLLFTATLSGSEQIHQMDYPYPFECKIK